MNDLTRSDAEQRKQALDPRQSFIVQAPAGSGKTELIIQRFLTLLAHVKKPEEILAITFTKKAAHEMRARVVNALEQALYQPEPEKAHEKLTWQLASAVLKQDREMQWELINNPNQLHIKTIDSFCSYLTGQLPLLSHFGAQPEIAVHPLDLYREAVYEVLSHVEEDHEWSPAVAKLLTHTDNDMSRLSKLLIHLLEKRDQWQHYLSDRDDIRDYLSRQIADVIGYHLESLVSRFPLEYSDELMTICRFAADNVTEESPIFALKNLLELPGVTSDEMRAWQGISCVLMNKENDWIKSPNLNNGFPALKSVQPGEEKIHREFRSRLKVLLEDLSQHEDLRSGLETIRKLPEPGYTDAQWEALKALLEVLKITLAQLRVTFQLYGKIDFIQNADGASLALGDETNPTDLALSLDYQIKHILVDEFQDTSSTQYYLLEMLTYGWSPNDGRSLFIVGDPMQSIYRFRQAEVGIFIRMQQHGIGDLRLIPLTLSVNFRSSSKIVEWNNQQFTAIFPDYSDIGSGAVHFSPSSANSAQENSDQSEITLQGFQDGRDEQQAAAVIQYAQEIIAKHPEEKIAILVRNRSHLSQIIPALKAAGLRYNALEIDTLITRQSTQDLLALTRALIHPADRIAWLAVLRAPWCGLSLSDLLKLCGQDRYHILWERMHQASVVGTLSSDGQARIATILPVLRAAMTNRARGGCRQWVEQTWLALGGPATLTEYNEIADTNEFFALLDELAGDTQYINLQALNERMTKLRASTQYDDAQIQIMTIHSAKGLEFDTVILPHLEKTGRPDEKSLLQWMQHTLEDDRMALLLAPIHAADSKSDALYSFIESLQKIKSRFEVDRLFYVAATRAKKRLHLVFSVKDSESGTMSGSFLDKLWPLIKNQCTLTGKDDGSNQTDAPVVSDTKMLSRFVSDWKNPAPIQQTTENSSQQNKNGFVLPDHSARLMGTVIHSILQQIAVSGISWWEGQSESDRHAYVRRQLCRAGLSAGAIPEAALNITTILHRSLSDKRGRWILEPHTESQSEYRLTLAGSDHCDNLIIDRTFVDNEGTRWIIDYKTGDNQEDSLDVFMRKQKDKYAEQMEKYKRAIQSIDQRPIKTGLYFPAIPAWCEW